MSNKAFVGTLVPSWNGGPGPQIIIEYFVVIDSNSNVVSAPPPVGMPVQTSQVPLAYNDNLLGIQQKVRNDIRSIYQDPNMAVIFVNGAGGLLNL